MNNQQRLFTAQRKETDLSIGREEYQNRYAPCTISTFAPTDLNLAVARTIRGSPMGAAPDEKK